MLQKLNLSLLLFLICTGTIAQNLLPNPSTNKESVQLSIQTQKAEALSINIINLTGQVLQRQKLNTLQGNNEMMLNIENLTAGVYYVVIEGTENRAVKKLVVGY